MIIEPWIGLTLLALLIQSGRTVLQKNLIGRLSVGGATYARFLYGAPLAWLVVAITVTVGVATLPHPSRIFFVYVTVGGMAQVLGNTAFVHLLRASNFTVITTYGKTETVISALFAFLMLGDRLSFAGLSGVLITFVGVMVLAGGKDVLTLRSFVMSIGTRDMLYGIAMGALYAVGSTLYRGAIISLEGVSTISASLFTLAWVTLIQAVVMGVWLRVMQPAVLRETFRNWRIALWVGVSGVAASAAWYMAFAQQVIAYVLAVGQADLLLAYLWSHFHFKERTKIGEIAGILVTVAGIILVVIGG